MSSATVSRVVNGSPLVVESTRLRVQKAIAELGYHPNHAARMLARDRTEMIAVIIPPLGKDYFREILMAVDVVAAAHQHHVMIALSHDLKDEKELIDRYVRERRADGLVIMIHALGYDAVIKRAGAAGLPVAVIGRAVKGPNLYSVSIDNREGAGQAVRHLAARGVRRLALLTGSADNCDSRERLEGARQAAAQCGLSLTPEWIWDGGFQELVAYDLIKERLSLGRPMPDGLFAFNDEMALGARAALLERGVPVPGAVALVGFDDISSARHMGLTTVHQPMAEMGRQAAGLLMDHLAGRPSRPAHCVLPTQLIARASTKS